jgi:putative nucleotidyltransferase with HDIG domain
VTLTIVADRNNNLVRLFGVLKTLADLGPAATAERDFTDTATDVLDKTLQALDSVQGALFVFDHSAVRLNCVATAGFTSISTGSHLQLGRAQAQAWMYMRDAKIIRPEDHRILFGDSISPLVPALKCVMPLRVSTSFVGGLLLGEREAQAEYGDCEREALGLLSGHLALLLQNHTLTESLRVQVADNIRLLSSLNHSYDDALEAFATTIDAKDLHMRGHSMRVGRYAAGMASSLGMSDAEITGIRAAGQLHDIGKVTVDKAVSNKPSALRPEEFREIADHTIMGHQIVSSVRFPWPQIPEVVRSHHERSDGSGYPDNLRLDDVSLPVRIIGVADTFDAMTSERPYRKGLSSLQAAEELVRLAPSKFDSNVVQALLVQLRWNFQGNGSQKTAPGLNGPQIPPAELDRLSISLVNKLTGNRVYSA